MNWADWLHHAPLFQLQSVFIIILIIIIIIIIIIITQVKITVMLSQINIAGAFYIIEQTSATAAPTTRVQKQLTYWR